MSSENTFYYAPTSQNILATCAMKLIHSGQILHNQALQKIEALSQECEDENELAFTAILSDAALLFQLDFQNKDAIDKSIEQIDNFLLKHTHLPKAFLSLKESINDFKIYLQLVNALNQALLKKSSNQSEFIADFENKLKPVLQLSLMEIEKNPLLKSILHNLMHSIQKLKLVQIQPRLADEPVSTRDKSRHQRWKEGMKAFKLYSSAPKVMSNHWIKSVLDNNKSKQERFVNDDLSVNQAGINRFATIINSAQSSLNEPLNQDDLALIGILFDRKAVKKVMFRYGLKGDGSLDYPFTKNNLNALLLGLAANLNNDEIKRLHPKALQVILQIKDSFKSSSTFASPENILALQK